MVGQPDRQVDRFEKRGHGLAVGPGQKEERLDDLGEVPGLALNHPEHSPVFLGGPLLPQRHVDLPLNGGQRSSQLVRGVAREPALPFERVLKAIEQTVDRSAQLLDLVAGARDRQSLVELLPADGVGRPGHAGHGFQCMATQPSPRDQGQRPERQRQGEQEDGEIAQGALHPLERQRRARISSE